jgi:hypothetical protein
MIPHERSLVQKLEGKPFALVGINSDQDEEMIKTQLEKHKISWRSFKNASKANDKTISDNWKVQGWPTLYLIDHKGVIRKKWVGGPSNEILEKAVNKLVAEAESGGGK